jgi:hypothetical protein
MRRAIKRGSLLGDSGGHESLPLVVESGAGLVEREVHELIKATRFKYAHPSDHAPVSVVAEY